MLNKIFIESMMRSRWYAGKGMLSGKNEKHAQKIKAECHQHSKSQRLLNPLQAISLQGSFGKEIIL